MPYFNDPNEQDPNNPQQAGTVQVSSPGSAPQAGQAGAKQVGSAPKAEKTGSNFTNIDKYFQANQGQDFGNKLAGKVQGEVGNANQSMQDAASSFSNKVNQNQAFGKEQVDAALNDPSKADAAAFQKGIDQQYGGPKALAESADDYNKFTGNTGKAQTAAKELGTEGGRFALLDNYFGRANYGFGQKALDNALVQKTPGIGQQTNAIQNQANQLSTQSKQMQDQLQAQASQKAGEIEAARNYQRQALGFDQAGNVVDNQGAFGGLQHELASGLEARNAQRAATQQGFSQALQNANAQGYDLTDEQIQQLGVEPGMSTYGVSLNNYLNPNTGALNMDQVATDEQRAKLSALNNLVGGNYSKNMLGAKQDATSDISFDKDRYLQDVAAAKQTEQENLADLAIIQQRNRGPRDAPVTPQQQAAFARAKSRGFTPMLNYMDEENAFLAKQKALENMRIY